MLKARLPKSERIKNIFQSGDRSLATRIRKQNNGSKTIASRMKTIAYKLLYASLICACLKKVVNKNNPLTPNSPIAETNHKNSLWFLENLISSYPTGTSINLTPCPVFSRKFPIPSRLTTNVLVLTRG